MSLNTLARGAILALALVVLLPCPSLALRRPERPQLFKLRNVDGWLGAGFDFDEETRKRPGRVDVIDKERDIFEELKIITKSSIYHPKFLLIDGSVLVRLEQEDRETTPSSVNQGDLDEIINEYDLNMAFLSERPYNLTLFGSRSTSNVDSLDFPEYDVTYERAGALLNWRNTRLPMWLSATRYEVQGGGTNRTDEETREVTYHVEEKTERRRSSFQYDWEEKDDRRSDTEVSSHRARLGNHLVFGPKNRSNLSTSGQFQRRDAFPSRQEASGLTNLRLFHSESFQTHYSYQGRWRETELEDTVTHGGALGFTHRLYRNLTTTANAGGTFTDADTGQTMEDEASLAFDYVRSLPFGSVTAGAGTGVRYREEDFITDVGEVLDETHSFSISNVVRLRNEFVQISTIVVTDTSGLTLFIEDIDYRVEVIGTLTEIVRLIGGTIPPGDTILVDYNFDRSRDQRLYSVDRQFRFSLDIFHALRLYTSFHRSDRHLLEGLERGGEDDISDWISGASFTRWGVHLNAEHQEHGSELIPYTADRVGAGVGLRLPLRSSVSASASWARTDFPNLRAVTGSFVPEDFSETVSYQARLTVRPLRNLSFEGGGFVRTEDGRVDSKEQVFFGEMRLRVRRVEVIVKGEHRRDEDLSDSGLETFNQRERNLIHFEVIRRF